MQLSCFIICVILHLAVLIQYQSVIGTRIQIDSQTDRHTTAAYTALSIASRGNNESLALAYTVTCTVLTGTEHIDTTTLFTNNLSGAYCSFRVFKFE